MAINRDLINWDTVFESKRYDEILNMLITNYRAIYGADISLNINSADGEYLRMLAQMLYDFSKLAGDVYNSFDINNAKGALLDNLVLLSGNLVRKSESKTKIKCTLSWTGDDIIYETTDILVIQDALSIVWRITPVNNVDSTLDNAGVEVYLECLRKGDYLFEENALEIRQNADFVTNDTIVISNVIIENRGSLAETDAQLRARKKESLSYNSTSLVDSIKEEVLNNIYSIQDIKIYNANRDENSGVNPGINITVRNLTPANQAIIIPLHDVFILVKPQEGVTIVENGPVSQALVEILRRKITLGISTWQDGGTVMDAAYHDVEVTVNEQFPAYTEQYRYYIAQPYSPAIDINITTLQGYNASNTLSRIRAALYEIAKNYPINKDINKAELTKVIYEQGNIDFENPTFLVNSISVTGGTAVNNGYWFVDGDNDTQITISTT